MADDGRVRSIAILGAGYVGGEMARIAIARGWRVAALTRNLQKAAALRELGCGRVVESDLASDAWHAEIGGPFDYVVNCTSPGGGGIEGYRHSCVEGMRSVGRWIATMPPATVVYTSSTGVYPQGDGARVDESAAMEEGEGRGGLLRAGEKILESVASESGWRWFVLRLAGIYGPGRHHLLDQVRSGVPLPGDPKTHLNLIHRDDACSAIVACLEAGQETRSAIFNLSDGAPGTREEVVSWLAEKLQLPRLVFAGADAPNPFGRRKTPDRIIDSSAIRATVGWTPKHAGFRSGFAAILDGS